MLFRNEGRNLGNGDSVYRNCDKIDEKKYYKIIVGGFNYGVNPGSCFKKPTTLSWFLAKKPWEF